MVSTTPSDLSTTDLPIATGHTRSIRAVSVWLFICAGMVFAMAIIGAITRLTESGLSMTEWRPLIGALPPTSEAEWNRVFDLYRETPEYRFVNAGMTLEEFKTIFFWEWLHRLWGRLIGLVFAVPFIVLWVSGTIRRAGRGRQLTWTLFGLLVLGGLQGLMGWVMVQSGLVDRPSVSHYRLAAHLGLAFLIFGLLIWVALSVRDGDRVQNAPESIRRHGWIALALTAATVLWGAMVAGLNAGLAYNSFPLMNGSVLPSEALALTPAWLNAFDNTAMVQFIHRWLAVVTAIVVLGLAFRAGQLPSCRSLASLLGIAVIVQVGLGITTLLLEVPITVATFHQAGALVVTGVLVALLHRFRSTRTVSASS